MYDVQIKQRIIQKKYLINFHHPAEIIVSTDVFLKWDNLVKQSVIFVYNVYNFMGIRIIIKVINKSQNV